MKTLNTLKMKIMVRAFRIRIKNGEAFEDIAADYPALTTDDLEAIKERMVTSESSGKCDRYHWPCITSGSTQNQPIRKDN